MGYYTNFKLSVMPDNIENLDGILEDNTGYYWSGLYLHEAKWYEHDADMKKISKLHPEHVFQLDGNGEDDDDIWRIYYKNGKSQRSKFRMVYDDFDERLLK